MISKETAGKIVRESVGFLAFLVAYCLEWVVFRMEVFNDDPSWVAQMVKAVPDGLLIYIFYWFLPSKWRKIALFIPLYVVSLFFFANIVYFRQYESLIPFTSMFFFDNFNALTFKSVLGLWRWVDLIYLLLPAGATVIYLRWPPGAASIRRRAVMVALTICSYLVCQAYYVCKLRESWFDAGIYQSWSSVISQKFLDDDSLVVNLGLNGLPAYVFKETRYALQVSGKKITLNEFQRQMKADFFEKQKAFTAELPDSVFASNRGKNVIMVIVESLNAEVVGKKINGKEVTPTLNGLFGAEGTIGCTKVLSQTGDGGSSDGQMLYNTGLLPLTRGAAAMLYTENQYASLAKLMGRKSNIEVIYEPRKVWNHKNTTRQYGYDALFSVSEDPGKDADTSTLGRDRALFNYALEILPTLPQPFFAELTTVSMHLPFQEEAIRPVPEFQGAGLPMVAANYYSATNYFDLCLGEFVTDLKRLGLYDDTILVIVSDHNCVFDSQDFTSSNDWKPGDILFLAANTGMTLDHTQRIGQVDVFPTLLDIAGVPYDPGSWRGMGISIMRKTQHGVAERSHKVHDVSSREEAIFLQDAWSVSDMLIRSQAEYPVK